MPFYANGIWYNWTSYLTTASNSISNTVSPTTAMVNGVNSALPWLWPVVLFALYFLLIIYYDTAPSRLKFGVIAGLVLGIAIVAVLSGLVADAMAEMAIFALAYFVSFVFRM